MSRPEGSICCDSMEQGCTGKYNNVNGISSYAFCTSYSKCNVTLDLTGSYNWEQFDFENIPMDQMCKIWIDTSWSYWPYSVEIKTLDLDKKILGSAAVFFLENGGYSPQNQGIYTKESMHFDLFWEDEQRKFDGYFMVFPWNVTSD